VSTHGGKRAGAGRKPLDPMDRTVPLTISVPSWLRDRLRGDAEVCDMSVSALIVAILTSRSGLFPRRTNPFAD